MFQNPLANILDLRSLKSRGHSDKASVAFLGFTTTRPAGSGARLSHRESADPLHLDSVAVHNLEWHQK